MYVELHCHSAYSFLDGASAPEELAWAAEVLGYSALALTDHNGLYGSMEFAHAVKGRGLQPITGAEVTLEDAGQVVLLAETAAGYAHLSRLLSHAHLQGERNRPRLPREQLFRHREGLIILSGGRGSDIGQALRRGEFAVAELLARLYRDRLGRDCFFLELQRNYVHGDKARNSALRQLARRLDLEVVATNNVHYHCQERHRLHDALVAVRHRKSLDDCHRERRANDEFYLKPPEEMEHLFRDIPEAIRNTALLAERCRQFDLTTDLGYVFPTFGRTREGSDAALAQLCGAAFREKYARQPETVRREARQRLEQELRLAAYHGLSGFFLVHHDLLELAGAVAVKVRGSRPRGQFGRPAGRGRGSSVSSILCYLIGLSPVDPIRCRLPLGRFLNEELASVPDIDLDFPRDIREELLRQVHTRYGVEHVAMVAAFPTYRLRSAVRDLGLALGLPPGDVDRLARLAAGHSSKDLAEEMRLLPGFSSALEAEAWQTLVELGKELSGFPRHLSQHSGGVIISSRPLVEIVPMEHSRMEGRRICQWDKDSCDDARFIKIDFLSLGMLSAVEECLDLIVENGKEAVDLARIPFDDADVYERICQGDTIGTFQIESRAQIQMLPRTQPRCLADLAVEVAIVRPGPIVGGAVNPYVRHRERQRRNPKAGVWYDHPLLRDALEDTLGVILYQDQVLEVCRDLAGFSVGRAEALRRAMSRKRSAAAMEGFREEFIAGARRKGVMLKIAERVFGKVTAFSEFGFPKGHAFSFAVLAYQSAWLCCYHPTEFVASLLNNQPMGFYSPDVLMKDAQRHGVAFQRPDINHSRAECTVSGNTVRLGLGAIEGIGSRAAAALVREREAGGTFRSLPDFLRRTRLPVGGVENLVLAGAFDSFGLDRRTLLWQLGLLARAQGWMNPKATGSGAEKSRRQGSFFPSTEQDTVPLPAMTPWQRMVADYRLMQLCPDTHPMALLRPALPKGVSSIRQLEHTPNGKVVQLAGLVVTRQRPGTAKGFVFLLIEDEWGLANVVVSPQLYERSRAVFRGEPLLWLKAQVQDREGSLNLIALHAEPLQDALRHLDVDTFPDDTANFLRDLRDAAPPIHQWH